MTPFERLAVVYFVALLVAAPRARAWRRGVQYALGAIALVIVARFALPWPARAWVAHAYLVLGYWIPAAFAPATHNERFEQFLVRADRYLTRAWHVPDTALFELAYLLCYPLVPAAFAVVFRFGSTQDIERFWVSVLASGYVCYVTLPWTTARPPRLMNGYHASELPRGLAAVNAHVLGRVSHQLVTFPSGHVAVSIAAAVEVFRVWPAAGAGFGVIALLIAIAAVAGRYHYLTDVILGLLVGGAIPVLVSSLP